MRSTGSVAPVRASHQATPRTPLGTPANTLTTRTSGCPASRWKHESAASSMCGERIVSTGLDRRSPEGRGLRLLTIYDPPMEARRVVTALFFDTVGSTALGERLDPEDLQLVIGAGVDRMVAAAASFGGNPASPSGDGGMVLFGAPVAHEDDPERAVRAGLRIIEEMASHAEEVSERWGIEGFGVRVGIETGLVALSAIGGAGGTGAMGDALNTAARLESAAPVGGV